MNRLSFKVLAFLLILPFSLSSPLSVRQMMVGLESEAPPAEVETATMPPPTAILIQEAPVVTTTDEMPPAVEIPPTVEEQPPVEEEATPSMAPMMDTMESSEYSFYYNIGGGETGMFMADPEDWVVGETAAFEMPDAEIVADMYPDVYKSHRYGLMGSTWGYDIPVTMAGVYDCTLMYAETYSEFFTAEPNRTMMVEIGGDDGEMQTATYDIMVELGGQEFTAYDRMFEGIEVQETLKIRQTPEIGDAFLSGIKCAYMGPLGM